jgi:hypothetical protein
MSQRIVKIHQTLHGYNDGHRLLKASRKAPSDIERLMLVMSDMSGSSMVHGFENYLTGYPLKEIKSYALARTWYAPEMKRPGCVWTHTLIIQNTDLANISDLWVLTASFLRPSVESKSWDIYASPLNLELDDMGHRVPGYIARIDSDRFQLLRDCLEGLYGFPQDQVFLPLSKISEEFEELTIALWSQQWARLRRGFKFCTGAISDRRLPDGAFDWQIIPRSSARHINLVVKNAVFVEPGTNATGKESLAWVETALEDLRAARPTNLRRFFRTFGAETSKGRAAYVPLVETFATLSQVSQGVQPLGCLIDAVARLFPSPREGARIKTAFFGKSGSTPDTPQSSPHGASEADVLSELARTEHYSAFDAEELQISSRARALVDHDLERATRVAYELLGSDRTALGEQFIDGFCEGLTSVRTFDGLSDQIDLVFPLLERKPILAASPNLWRGSEYEQRRVFDFIRRQGGLNRDEVGRVITAMLSAHSDAVAREVAFAYSDLAVETVLAWCDSLPVGEVFKIGKQWKHVLANQPELAIRWLKSSVSTGEGSMVLLANLLDPHSGTVQREGAAVWVPLAHRAKVLLSGDLLTATMSFLLAIGFDAPDKEAVTLVVEAFEPVHAAAEANRLGDANWRRLSYQAPSISWFGDWDKCSRLRSALIEHFIRHRWRREEFLLCLKTPTLLQKVVVQVLQQGSWFNKQLKYLQKIAAKAVSGELKATKRQRDILAASFDL